MFGIGGQDVVGGDMPLGGGDGSEVLFPDDALDVQDAGGAGEGDGVGAADLESVPRPGIVRGGDHDGGIGAEQFVGIVGHGSRAEAEIDDLGAMEREPAGQCLEERFGMGAHVAADDDLLAAEEREDGAADLKSDLVGEGLAIDAADVVCLENACHGVCSCQNGCEGL